VSWLERVANLVVHRRWGERPGAFDPAQVRRILVVRNDNIGDVICTTPALDALRAAFPAARIAAVVCTLTEEAISGHRALDRLYVYPKAKHKQHGLAASHWLLTKVLTQLRRERFDLVVSFRSSFSTSQGWLAFASGGRWRLGPEARGRRRRWGFFHNLPAPWPPPGIHEVERCFDLLARIRVDSQDKRLYLKVPAPARAAADIFWRREGLRNDPAPVALNITRWAYRPDRAWPPERYQALARALAARPGGLVVTHAPADGQWVAGLMEAVEPRPPTFCSPSLKEFSAVAAKARAFITVEGGPMHLAAAAGAPLVVLWADAPQEVWRPWASPCRLVGGRGPVSDIAADEVLAVLDDLLDSTGQGKR